MKIKSQKDFFAGLMFCITGAAFGIGATNYTIGDGARMGPGYFPLMLGVILAGMGAFIIFESVVIETPGGEPVGKWAWKPLAYILGANLAFGLLLGGMPKLGIPSFGLIIAIYALVMISSKAAEVYNMRHVLTLATILAIGSYAAFILLLKLQIQVWPSFITG